MKLKEPLQGLKLIQGHIVMHLALFLGSFSVQLNADMELD